MEQPLACSFDLPELHVVISTGISVASEILYSGATCLQLTRRFHLWNDHCCVPWNFLSSMWLLPLPLAPPERFSSVVRLVGMRFPLWSNC